MKGEAVAAIKTKKRVQSGRKEKDITSPFQGRRPREVIYGERIGNHDKEKERCCSPCKKIRRGGGRGTVLRINRRLKRKRKSNQSSCAKCGGGKLLRETQNEERLVGRKKENSTFSIKVSRRAG